VNEKSTGALVVPGRGNPEVGIYMVMVGEGLCASLSESNSLIDIL